MKHLIALLALVVFLEVAGSAADPTYADEIKQWQQTREKKLNADNGWLTLAGRFPLKPGANTFGTGKDNDVVFPPELKEAGTERLGTLLVDVSARKVTLKLPEGVSWMSEGKPFTDERVLGSATDKRDWVGVGRISMHIISREGRYVLRLADNESLVRRNFSGCIWYPANEKYKVEAKFVPYPAGKTLSIVNILDEASQQPCPGYVEFQLDGVTHKLDAIKEGAGLFFVFSDKTAGDTTYSSARFIDIEKQPQDKGMMILDFNKAYNPPCAFSSFTTCPRPPPQNVLKVRIEAGERYRGR